MKKVYLSRKSYVRFDDDHFLLYIGEQKVENYHPETSGTSDTKSEASDSGKTAFSYEGDEADGSTKIKAKSATYGDFTGRFGTHQIQPESGRGNLGQSRRWR